MNKLKATIKNIESSASISLVDLESGGTLFSCVIIETPDTADYLAIGNKVDILFKETEVSITKDFNGVISLRNKIVSIIKSIDRGKILSKLILDFNGEEIGSVITTRSVNQLNLKIGDRVAGYIKANEVSIMKDGY